jgi:Ca2+-transporting ATPase
VFGAEPLAPNRTLRLALAGSFGLQAAAALVPGLRGLLGLAPVGALDLAVAGAGALLPFAVNEATKGAARPGAA